jgi:hypothetical protein
MTGGDVWAMHLTLNGHTTRAHGETFPSYDLAMGAALSITREGRQGWADHMGQLAAQEWQRAGAAGTLAQWLGVPDTGGAVWGWRVSLVADGGGK